LHEGRSRPTESSEPCTLAPLLAFATPDKRRGIRIPASYRLLQPADDLLCLLGMLASQSAPHDDALHGLGHIEPRASQRRIERHDAVAKKPGEQVVGEMACQIVPHQQDAQRWQPLVALMRPEPSAPTRSNRALGFLWPTHLRLLLEDRLQDLGQFLFEPRM